MHVITLTLRVADYEHPRLKAGLEGYAAIDEVREDALIRLTYDKLVFGELPFAEMLKHLLVPYDTEYLTQDARKVESFIRYDQHGNVLGAYLGDDDMLARYESLISVCVEKGPDAAGALLQTYVDELNVYDNLVDMHGSAFDGDEAGLPKLVRNTYRCQRCTSEGTTWSNVWLCTGESRCPVCGRMTEPYDIVEV